MEQDADPNKLDDKKGFFQFSRNIAEVPCYRDSLLNGIYSGFAGGLFYFLFTSNTRTATHFAVGAFSTVSLGYWCVCRYKYTKLKFELAQIAAGLKQKTLYEGTVVERELEKKLEEKGIDVKNL